MNDKSFEERVSSAMTNEISQGQFYLDHDDAVGFSIEADETLADKDARIAELESDLSYKNKLLQDHSDKYCDLIYEVKMKYPDESRHETAKRIIHDNQNQTSNVAQKNETP